VRRVIVAGALANKPGNGGEAWVRLSWVQALEALGFEVLFLEEISPGALVDRRGRSADFQESWNLGYFREVTEAFGLGEKACLLRTDGGEGFGPSLRAVTAWAREAELLVNIGGHLTLEDVRARVRVRAYVDIDPGYVQIWQAAGIPGARLGGHDHYFTIGERIGTAGCPVPTLGLRWIPIRQPVLLEEWVPAAEGEADRFTTVSSWRGAFGPVELDGRTFGPKAHQFRRFLDLPSRTPAAFEIALQIHGGDEKDRKALEAGGWRVVDPAERCGDPQAFRRYVQESWAEFSVAQGVYVGTRCGWFSDRTVRYLASGKPVLVQETVIRGLLPTGEGLLTFETMEEAEEGVRRIRQEYREHARAARRLAEEHFAPERALAALLEETGAAA
jgi:hypothetical protein